MDWIGLDRIGLDGWIDVWMSSSYSTAVYVTVVTVLKPELTVTRPIYSFHSDYFPIQH